MPSDKESEKKSNFLATVSHEMRTPMQSVYGLLELIELEEISPSVREMTETARSSASSLLEILDDILDFAKMDAEMLELDDFEVPVRTLVRGTLEALTVKIQGKPIQLVDDIQEDVPFVIKGDPKRLRQILVNLCGNAFKFTAEGEITVRVSTNCQNVRAAKGGTALRFEVIDTGIGMSAEAASRLFKPFSQADSSTSRKYGGTGLGLSICKKLVELMNGQIGVKSKEGEGAVFWFEIPTRSVSTEANTVDFPDLSGVTVLSVEDHPQGAKEIVNSLKSMGAHVDSVATVAEGREFVKSKPYDVGIIDQGLPDGLGLGLIRYIMDMRPFMGLIMYTVRDDAGLQHSLQSLGVTYLSKPASRAGLGEAVKDAARKVTKYKAEGAQKLLIAEDTESVRDLLKRQLDKLGVAADFVENGAQAIEKLKTGNYGILFTDLHMPEMDGYALVEQIRKNEAEEGETPLPIIVLTADVQMAQRQVYLGYGFNECLLKPVSLGHFRRLLIRWGLLNNESQKVELQANETGSTELKTEEFGDAICLKTLEAQMGTLDESAIEMLGMFIDMTSPLITKLKEAHANDDSHDVSETAHSLKGAARSAAALRLGDIAADLQDSSEKGEYDPSLIENLAHEFSRVKSHIENLTLANK
ncbi:MAG: hybrid sensor histidine kinase/response regulator [Alphaproteobacteria bacterium]|nr:hybrid sensor histidine kinase/response regulator [Alphaproteobacteria bacterium]